ncbi:MAG: NAD-dependent epimerase/dehydratase family protein [Candidatus Heimdallarchaeota archaeon]|nr:NAD-dependent epimerase/dehydratase family protein [Candidatus Heimdallarchaeota archaeon]
MKPMVGRINSFTMADSNRPLRRTGDSRPFSSKKNASKEECYHKMKVLLTGAFGNIGSSTLSELVKRKHYVRCFDIKNKNNRKKAKKYRNNDQVEIVWGDIRNLEDVTKAVAGIDVVIHLAAIIPPLANQKPLFAEKINVDGTKNLLSAMEQQPNQPKLIFGSSVAVYGDVRHKGTELIKVTDPYDPSPLDHYARMKIKCEKMIEKSTLDWVIFRFAAIPPIDLKTDPLMFEVPLDTPMEFCHTTDTGLALAKAVDHPKVWGEIFHIGGGEECRVPYKVYVTRLLESFGIGGLPAIAFSDKPFHCGYMDTTKSQGLLKYQRHTFDDLVEEMKNKSPFLRILTIIFRPIVRLYLLRQSPYYREYTKRKRAYIDYKSIRAQNLETKRKEKKATKTNVKDSSQTKN